MGTAVLLPQDCLSTSKNRHKSHLSESIFYSDGTSRVRRGVSQASALSTTPRSDNSRKNTASSRVEWTVKSSSVPFHNHGSVSIQADGLQEEVNGGKDKVRKSSGVRETRADMKSATDGPVFTILQRPKSKEAADELIAKFLMKVEEEKVLDGQHDQISLVVGSQSVMVDEVRLSPADKLKPPASVFSKVLVTKLPGSKCKRGAGIMKQEVPKASDSNIRAPKLVQKKLEGYTGAKVFTGDKGQGQKVAGCVAVTINGARREGQRVADEVMNSKGLSQVASLRSIPDNHNLTKAGSASTETLLSKQSQLAVLESIAPNRLSRLKRATTDPQIVKQLVGHYKSETVNIPFSEAKSCHGFIKSTSMSCPERWAGPSYFSSPAPSSLPLPKFSLVHQKMSPFSNSAEVLPNSTQQVPDMGSSSPVPSPPQGGYLDVAFATKSLRRMLKLDPF